MERRRGRAARRWLAVVLVVGLASLLAPGGARAKSWCASPLWVHEWGVQVFRGPRAERVRVALPGWFHERPEVAAVAAGGAVRALPADSGDRDLPVVQFYTPPMFGERVPVGLEVDFTQGHATAWYPQVDLWRDEATAHSAAALAGRQALLAARAARQPYSPTGAPLEADPSRQLSWERLELTREPSGAPREAPATPWVQALRAIDGALWVQRGEEAERFVFYEGATREAPALTIERGDTWAADRPHYVLVNTSAHAVHDVLLIDRRGGEVRVFAASSIPAGKRAGFVLEAVAAERVAAVTRERLVAQLVDHDQPAPPADDRWDMDDCVMGRDPALPVEQASGHRLYAAEVEVLMSVWSERMFEQEGSTLLYREDTAQLDAAMPLAVYTDMYHVVILRRAGLVLWEGLDLAAMSAP